MPNISEWPNAAVVCSLSQVLETDSIPQRYFLSSMACAGILRRAAARGKTLPAPLQQALASVAGNQIAEAPQAISSRSVQCYGGGNTSGAINVAACLTAKGQRIDFEVETFAVQAPSYAIQAGALRTNPSSGPDGVGVQEHIAYTLEARAEVQAVAFSCKDYGADATFELAPTMRAMGHVGSHANAGGQLAVCVTGEITHTLKAEGFDASEDGTGRGQPIVPIVGAMCAHTYTGGLGGRVDMAAQGYVQPVGMAVRRLTPRECERLQGFPDDYTLIPNRGKPMADGPRYKALGNSWAVPKFAWLGARIDAALRGAA